MINSSPELSDSLTAADVGRVQRDLLLKSAILPNQDCEFGRQHGFSSIRSVREFQKAVPLSDYEDLRPDIDRMASGESGILVSEPVRRFFVTSGSTAKPKLVPVTSSFIRDKWRAFQKYWGMVRRDHPAVASGKLIANFTDATAEQTTLGGARCSSESSFWSAWGGTGCDISSGLIRDIRNIRDPNARFYTIARVLLNTNVTGLMALNPSTISRLFDVLGRNSEPLIEDVERGGLSGEIEVEPRIRQYLEERFPGDSTRAENLRKIFARKDEIFQARDVWPNLQVTISWRSPMLSGYLEMLERYLVSVPQRDYITMASEGIVAIPYCDTASGGALAIDTHFYEFIPEKFSEDRNAPTLLAQDLEIGQKYVVVLTTSAGLYRYILGDVVEVSTFIGSTPVLSFLHRTGHTCSMTGEKLTEDQVTRAVGQAAAELGLPIHNFTMCPVVKPFPHYALLAEIQPHFSSDLGRFLAIVDSSLSYSNVEYKAKRASGRLGAPELLVLPLGSYAKVREQHIAAGVSDAQVKIPCLTRDWSWHQKFEIVSRIECESPV